MVGNKFVVKPHFDVNKVFLAFELMDLHKCFMQGKICIERPVQLTPIPGAKYLLSRKFANLVLDV